MTHFTHHLPFNRLPLRKAFSTFATALPFALLMLVMLVSITDAAQAPDPAATLRVSAVPSEPALAIAHGSGFTPGGTVLLTITSEAVPDLSFSVWTAASEAIYGPDGSQDPARGYVPAGQIESFISLDAGVIHGPNGSQDPAQGYMTGVDWFAAACSAGISVHAFDVTSVSFSNEVALDVNC